MNQEIIEEHPIWTIEEDGKILELVNKYGTGSWSVIGSFFDTRTGKQCRERWHNILNPAIKKSQWLPSDDQTIITGHKEYGSSWSQIANMLPGRSHNAIKNRWNSIIRRVARQQAFMTAEDDQNPRKKIKRSKQISIDSSDPLYQYCCHVYQTETSLSSSSHAKHSTRMKRNRSIITSSFTQEPQVSALVSPTQQIPLSTATHHNPQLVNHNKSVVLVCS